MRYQPFTPFPIQQLWRARAAAEYLARQQQAIQQLAYFRASNGHSHPSRPDFKNTTGPQQLADERTNAQHLYATAAVQRAAYQELADIRAMQTIQPPQAHQTPAAQTEASRQLTHEREPPMAHQASTLQKNTYQQLADKGRMHTTQLTNNNHFPTSQIKPLNQHMDHMRSSQTSEIPRQTAAYQHIRAAHPNPLPHARHTYKEPYPSLTYKAATAETINRGHPNQRVDPQTGWFVDQRVGLASIQAVLQPKSEMRAAGQTVYQPYADRPVTPQTVYRKRNSVKRPGRRQITPPIAAHTAAEPKADVLGGAHITYQPSTDTFATAHVAYQPNTDMYTKSEIIYQPRTNMLAAKQLVYQPRTDMIATAETVYQPETNMMSTRQTMFQPQEETIRTTESVYQPHADFLATRESNFQYRKNLLNTTETIYQPRADMNIKTQNASKPTESMYHAQADLGAARQTSFQYPMDELRANQSAYQTQAETMETPKNPYEANMEHHMDSSQTAGKQQKHPTNSKTTVYETQKATPILRQILSSEQKQDKLHTPSYLVSGNMETAEQIQRGDVNKVQNKTSSRARKSVAPRKTLRQTRKRKLSAGSDCTPGSQTLVATHQNSLTESEWLTRLESHALSWTKSPDQPRGEPPAKKSVGRPRTRRNNKKATGPLPPELTLARSAETPPPSSLEIAKNLQLQTSTTNWQVNHYCTAF